MVTSHLTSGGGKPGEEDHNLQVSKGIQISRFINSLQPHSKHLLKHLAKKNQPVASFNSIIKKPLNSTCYVKDSLEPPNASDW